MSSYVFNNAKNEISIGGIDFSSDTFKITLVKPFPESEKEAIEWEDIESYEISGTDADGYKSGGVTLSNVGIFMDGDNVLVSATNVDDWGEGVITTINANGAIIFRETDDLLICAIDLGEVSSSSGSFTVRLQSGFLKIK
ncbi:MAG: hypothetical protein WC260_01800 [Candidatus Pacearchaeota archaeon]